MIINGTGSPMVPRIKRLNKNINVRERECKLRYIAFLLKYGQKAMAKRRRPIQPVSNIIPAPKDVGRTPKNSVLERVAKKLMLDAGTPMASIASKLAFGQPPMPEPKDVSVHTDKQTKC